MRKIRSMASWPRKISTEPQGLSMFVICISKPNHQDWIYTVLSKKQIPKRDYMNNKVANSYIE